MSVDQLIEVTRRYGGNPDYVLAGGGNTSLKKEGILYIKASGASMASIDETGFVKMDQAKLDAIWRVEYPEDQKEREEQALTDLMNARLPEETSRPSVETLLHSFIPFRFVVHTHPAFVNGLTCSVKGEEVCRELWGDKMLWIPVVNPGYILARYVKDRVDEFTAGGKPFPEYIILQNHGIFTGGETLAEVDRRYESLMGKLENRISTTPDMEEVPVDRNLAEILKRAVKQVYGAEAGCYFYQIRQCVPWLSSLDSAAPVLSSLTPDHIVYMGHTPLWLKEGESPQLAEELIAGTREYEKTYGKKPKTILLQNQGILSCGESEKTASLSKELFHDAVKVAVLSENFGGIRFMPQDKIDFINNWEVEQYRAKESTK